jgi:hypothetical protein
MTMCESCRRLDHELTYCKATDEYLCEECIILLAEHYYRSTQESEGESEA